MKIAHQSGFSQENLALACVNSQIDAKYLCIIFSGGVDDLLQFMQEQQMLEIQTIASANELFDGLKISEKIGSIGCVLHVGKSLTLTEYDSLNNMYKSLKYIQQ